MAAYPDALKHACAAAFSRGDRSATGPAGAFSLLRPIVREYGLGERDLSAIVCLLLDGALWGVTADVSRSDFPVPCARPWPIDDTRAQEYQGSTMAFVSGAARPKKRREAGRRRARALFVRQWADCSSVVAMMRDELRAGLRDCRNA